MSPNRWALRYGTKRCEQKALHQGQQSDGSFLKPASLCTQHRCTQHRRTDQQSAWLSVNQQLLLSASGSALQRSTTRPKHALLVTAPRQAATGHEVTVISFVNTVMSFSSSHAVHNMGIIIHKYRICLAAVHARVMAAHTQRPSWPCCCYTFLSVITEKAPNTSHHQGTQKTVNTDNQHK